MSKSPASLFLTAFFASALLVSATLLLLQATVKWGALNMEVEDPNVARGGSGSPSTRVASGAASRQQHEQPSLSPIAPPSAMAAEPDYTSSVSVEPEAVASASAGSKIIMPSSEDGRDPALSDTGPAEITAKPEDEIVSVDASSDPGPDVALVSEVPHEIVVEPEEEPASVEALPDPIPESTLVSESPPGESAPEQVVGEAVSIQIPEDSAVDQAEEAEEEIVSEEEAPAEPVSEGMSATDKEVRNLGRAVPLPQRRPARSTVSASEPVARSDRREDASPPRKPRWKAMTLAPNELAANPPQQAKPSSLFPNLLGAKPPPRQAKRPSAKAYNAKIWSALARHKPRAGRRGSTSVTFGIGANGALVFARVSGSSGDSRLDQLALATVRGAAPFPSPPNGAQSFTIRIHFR